MKQPRKSPEARQRFEASNQNTHTHISPSAILLPRLEGLITTGRGWRARCPAHGGTSASLAIAEGDNGTLLVHAFCGCKTHDVLAAIGLKIGDLFHQRDRRTMTPAERSRLREAALLPRWRAAMEVLVHEATVLQIAASKMGDGETLDADELTRLRVAALKVFDASEVLNAR